MPEPINYSAESKVFERDWSAYYSAVVGRPPRDTLLAALERFDAEQAGELLRRGWRVLAIDGEQEAIARLLSRPDINRDRLETQAVRFEEVNLPEQVDLVNASFSLPFCPPEHFPSVWEKIVASLRPGGRFCGQLFGDRDSWAIYTSVTHHTREQVEELLRPFELEMFVEEEHPGQTALGEEKYWHLFQIVARKRWRTDLRVIIPWDWCPQKLQLRKC